MWKVDDFVEGFVRPYQKLNDSTYHEYRLHERLFGKKALQHLGIRQRLFFRLLLECSKNSWSCLPDLHFRERCLYPTTPVEDCERRVV